MVDFRENDLLDTELYYKHQELVMRLVQAVRELTAEAALLEKRLKDAEGEIEHIKWYRCDGVDCGRDE
jgi:hypothetical protein